MFSTAGGQGQEAAAAGSEAAILAAQAGRIPAGDAGEGAQPGDRSGRYSPAVTRLAGEHGVDLERLHGSGAGGRITRKDVQHWIDRQPAAAADETPAGAAREQGVAAVAPVRSGTVQDIQAGFEGPRDGGQATAPAVSQNAAAPGAPTVSAASRPGDVLEPLTATRRAIARHMAQSVQTSPHAWMMVEVDVSRLVSLREESATSSGSARAST